MINIIIFCYYIMTELKPSSRKDKKYMVKHDNKTIHFGAKGMRDFTLMNDKSSKFYEPSKEVREKAKANYQTRHKKDPINTPFTAGSLSYYLLWNKPTLSASIRDYNKMFKTNIKLTR